MYTQWYVHVANTVEELVIMKGFMNGIVAPAAQSQLECDNGMPVCAV